MARVEKYHVADVLVLKLPYPIGAESQKKKTKKGRYTLGYLKLQKKAYLSQRFCQPPKKRG